MSNKRDLKRGLPAIYHLNKWEDPTHKPLPIVPICGFCPSGRRATPPPRRQIALRSHHAASLSRHHHRPRCSVAEFVAVDMLGSARRSVAALSRVGGAWHQWRGSPAAAIHTSFPLTEVDAKHIDPRAIWFPVLSATKNGGYGSLPNLNQRSSFLFSRRYVSTSVATDTNPPGERFKCQHETRGRICKTLEKRNILDHKRRLLAAKYELRRKLYKAICRDPDLPSDMRDKHRCKLSKLPRNSSFVRVRNRCIFTGRPRAVLKMFRMSRIVFREKASQGSLMGIKKSSW